MLASSTFGQAPATIYSDELTAAAPLRGCRKRNAKRAKPAVEDPMKGDEEQRLAERRAKFERRSGGDSRSSEEREQVGERRVVADRRLGGDRRSQAAKPSKRSVVAPILTIVVALCAFDVYFENGRHTVQPAQAFADNANADISRWVGAAFPNRN
jgi:hypothetical protein